MLKKLAGFVMASLALVAIYCTYRAWNDAHQPAAFFAQGEHRDEVVDKWHAYAKFAGGGAFLFGVFVFYVNKNRPE